MSILLEHEYETMYGRIRLFKADRCMNNESLRNFNKNKLKVKEIVSFDSGLFDLEEMKDDDNDFLSEIFEQIILIVVRPDADRIDEYTVSNIEIYEFCGYDLVEMDTYISAITNSAARFDQVIDYQKLSKFGLISNYLEAVKTQIILREYYPNENHAYCEVVEVWRKLAI